VSLLSAQQEDSVMAEINITPFTDVLLVLLIIFMILAALITPPGFQKELPNNNSNPSSAKSDPKKEIDVEVNDKGVIFVDNKKTDAVGIYGVMAEAASKRGKLHVSITADAKAPYGVIIRILDAARVSDLEDVGFVTS
jgi:biopolymer transport protein ExbD